MGHQTRIMYVERARANHRDTARISRVRFSKTGRTLYVWGLTLKPCSTTARRNGRTSGIYGNYIDPATETEYWVSGPKKRGGDRHWAGGGDVIIDGDVLKEYWREIRECEPPETPHIA